MSTTYQKSKEVPTKVLLDRVEELILAITGDRTENSFRNEFTMRIPAEVDRDADLVLQEVADRLEKAEADLAEAIDLLKAAKAQFAPTTTNSIADDFLKRMEKRK